MTTERVLSWALGLVAFGFLTELVVALLSKHPLWSQVAVGGFAAVLLAVLRWWLPREQRKSRSGPPS